MSGLPKGWETAEVSDVATVIRGVTYQKERSAEEPGEGLLPVLRATNITGHSLTFDGLVYVPAENVSEDQLLKQGDVVIASSSGSKEIVGKAGSFWANGFIGSFGAFCTGVRPSTQLASKYFEFYFQTPSYRKSVSALSAGSNINNLKSGDLAAQHFPLPPRAEQTRIVAKLEELLSDLDAGVAELKAAQKKLQQYRQSLLKAAVEGALTADWRAARRASLPSPARGKSEARGPKPAGEEGDNETGAQLLARILRERRARWEHKQLAKFKDQGKKPPKNWQSKYPEPIAPEPIAPDTTGRPELPEGWVWATIDQLASIGTGVTPLKSKSEYYRGGDIPWVTSGALNDEMVTSAADYVTSMAIKECRLELYPSGTLLVAMYGEGKTRGKCSELAIPATINQAIAALVLDESALTCKPYLKSFLLKSYGDMRNQASGGVQPNLNLQIIRSIAVPLPPPGEQREVTSILAEQLISAGDQQSSINLAVSQSTAQRQNILRAAFAGQLVPQDPNDEPASVLLERIRTERAASGTARKPRAARKGKIA